MEELRASDALDREILEDARKKADKILRAADTSISKAEAEWAKRGESDLAQLDARYEAELAQTMDEIRGRAPLDKRRLRSEYAGKALEKAMFAWLDSLPRPRVLSLLARELSVRLPRIASESGPFKAKVSGLSRDEAASLLKGLPCTIELLSPAAGACPAAMPSCQRALMRIEGQGIVLRVSIDELASRMLDEKRAELARSLLGEGVLND